MNNAKSIKKIFQTYIYACKSLFNFKNTHLKVASSVSLSRRYSASCVAMVTPTDRAVRRDFSRQQTAPSDFDTHGPCGEKPLGIGLGTLPFILTGWVLPTVATLTQKLVRFLPWRGGSLAKDCK